MLATKSLTFQEVLDLPLRDVLSSASAVCQKEDDALVRVTSTRKSTRPAALFIVTRFTDDKGDVITKQNRPALLDPIVFLSKREAVSYANHYDALLIEVRWDKLEGRYGKGTLLQFPSFQKLSAAHASLMHISKGTKAAGPKANRKRQKPKAKTKAKAKAKTRQGAR